MKNKIVIKSLKKGIIINLLVTIITGIFSFIINKYFLKFMGLTELGLMRLFTQMIAYLNLAELGIGTAGAYMLYGPLKNKNYEQINTIVSTIKDIYKKIAISILIIGLLMSPMVLFFIKDLNGISKLSIIFYWNLYVVMTSISYTYGTCMIVLIANQEYEYIRLIQGTIKIIINSLQVFVIINNKSFLLFIVLLIIENILQYILLKKYFIKNYFYIKKSSNREKTIFKDLKNLFWHKISGIIVYNTDYIIISKFLSLSIVGIYSSYLIIITTINTLVSVVTNVISPRIGLFISQNSKQDAYDLWEKLNIIYLYISLLLSYTTYKLINNFIFLWLGEEYMLSKVTIILIIINLFIQLFRSITDIFKNGYGYFDDIYLPMIEGVLNLVISLVLVREYGLNGVIIGTIVSNFVVLVIAKPMLVLEKCFHKNFQVYLKILFKYIFLVIINLLILNLIFNYVIILKDIVNWSGWIKTSIILTLITSITLFITFFMNNDFRYMILKFKSRR